MPSRDSQKSRAERAGVIGVDSMFPPPRSGAYASGTVAGVMTSAEGSGSPWESTVTPGVPISVTDRLEVVGTVSPLDSG